MRFGQAGDQWEAGPTGDRLSAGDHEAGVAPDGTVAGPEVVVVDQLGRGVVVVRG
jgi:hypothetical protein